jgi:hypothetical protein
MDEPISGSFAPIGKLDTIASINSSMKEKRRDMFDKKIVMAVVGVMFFLVSVAFIMGKPQHRDSRIYPIVREYSPFVVENGLGGLKIKRRDNPSFSEEPDAVNFYSRMEELEREWAKRHLKREAGELLVMDDNGTVLKRIELKSESERRFVKEYYGVR